jgi:hypothetical protein
MQISNFLQKCIGISLVTATLLFGSAALIGTISPAKADNPTAINATGKIMMHQNSFVYNGHYYFQVLVWDTETGKSKFYDLENEKLVSANLSLPSSPLY